MEMGTATAGPGPATSAYRARTVPGHYPLPTSFEQAVVGRAATAELQPPLELVFVMGIAGYLLSLFYLLPCTSTYLPLPLPKSNRRRVSSSPPPTRPAPVRHVTFTPRSLQPITTQPLPLVTESVDQTTASRKRNLGFGLSRSSKDKAPSPPPVTHEFAISPPISPRSSVSGSRSPSPEQGERMPIKARCSKIKILNRPSETRPPMPERHSFWRRSASSTSTVGTTTRSLQSEDDTEVVEESTTLPSIRLTLVPPHSANKQGFLANLRRRKSSPRSSVELEHTHPLVPVRAGSLDISSCPIKRELSKSVIKGRTNPYIYMDSDAALPDYERRRREKQSVE